MFSSSFPLCALFLGLTSLVHAAPVKPTEFVAFAPIIITPSANTIWVAGSSQNVSWLTDNVPVAAQDHTVNIFLGYFANSSENLDIERPLATQIPIMQGSVTVTVPPNTTYGTNYTVNVNGDSGNASPPFTIVP